MWYNNNIIVLHVINIINIIINPQRWIKTFWLPVWFFALILIFIQQDKFSLSCVTSSAVQELMRGIRLQLDSLISGDLGASFSFVFIDHK